MVLSRKELLRLQQQGKTDTKPAGLAGIIRELQEKLSPGKSPKIQYTKPENKYLKVIRGDINTIMDMFTGRAKKYLRERQQRNDFMEHHFKGLQK